VIWDGHPNMDMRYESPESMAPFIDKNRHYMFLPHAVEWQTLISKRLDDLIDTYALHFRYAEDFSVNDDLMEKVLGKMKIDKSERKELFAQHEARNSLTASGHGRYLLSSSLESDLNHRNASLGLFTPVRIDVRIEFFTVLDYWEMNRTWIQANWSSFHVQAFLRIIRMNKYEDMFADREIDGASLLMFNDPSEGITPTMKLIPEDIRTLKGLVRRLGSVDNLDILDRVAEEEVRVRAAYERKIELLLATQRQKQQQQQQQQASLPPKVPKRASFFGSSSSKSPATPNPPSVAGSSSPSHTSSTTHDPSSNPTQNGTPPRPDPIDNQDSAPPPRHREGTVFSEGLYEVVIVGDGAVGKTSIMNRICGIPYHSAERPTIGSRLTHHVLGKLVIDIWDTGGQAAQLGTAKARARKADIVFAVYDVTNKDSLINLKSIVRELTQNGIYFSS
jgi:hypothetical protein